MMKQQARWMVLVLATGCGGASAPTDASTVSGSDASTPAADGAAGGWSCEDNGTSCTCNRPGANLPGHTATCAPSYPCCISWRITLTNTPSDTCECSNAATLACQMRLNSLARMPVNSLLTMVPRCPP